MQKNLIALLSYYIFFKMVLGLIG